jgi:tripartite-type tricarboxylate transporter receptor subunit TctC
VTLPEVEQRFLFHVLAQLTRQAGYFHYLDTNRSRRRAHFPNALRIQHFQPLPDPGLKPYKGSGPALTDLVGGHVAVYFSSLPPALALVKEGKVRALAVTGAKRSPIFPDLPTVAEAALPGYEAVLHYGIVAPAGTSRPILDKLSAALRAAVMSEDLKARLANDGAEPLASTPEEYAADIDREESKWSAIVKASGAKAE